VFFIPGQAFRLPPGFERLRLLLSEQPTTAQIARIAQQFGQEDDISVLQISRLPIPA
jgi:hypothetical protein